MNVSQEPNTAKGQSQVRAILEKLERTIAENKELKEELHTRLCPVLRNEPGKDEANEAITQELVPLANNIRQMVEELEYLNKGYADLIKRIEL